MIGTIAKDFKSKFSIFKMVITRHPSIFIVLAVLFSASIVIQVFSSEPSPAEWSWTQRISVQIIKYISDWGLLIAAIATILLALAAFLNISYLLHFRRQDTKKSKAKKLIDWATKALNALVLPDSTGKSPEQVWEEYSEQLASVRIEFLTIISDAVLIGGDVAIKMTTAVGLFLPFLSVIEKRQKPPPSLPLINSLQKLIETASKI